MQPALVIGDGVETAETAPALDLPVSVIERRSGWRVLDLGELWRYRELLFFLTWRDIKVRYKQTVLGAAWAVLQPLATMVVFTLFLGRFGGEPSTDVPYPLFVFAGLLPWTFFANAINSANNSIAGNQSLITKTYFPRLLIPVAAVAAGVVDFAIAFVMLLIMMPLCGILPGRWVLLAPLVVLTLVLAAVAVGTLLSALTVAYRDFRYIVPLGVQLWMFATPTIFFDAGKQFSPRWQALLPLNPAYGLIDNFRRVMLGGTPDWYSFAVSGAVGLVLLLAACLYFRRVETTFADII